MTSRILQFHEREDLIAGAKTAAGKGFVWLAGIALLSSHDASVLMLPAFTLVLLFPEKRRFLLMLTAFGTVAVTVLGRQGIHLDQVLTSAESFEWVQWIGFLAQFSFLMISIFVVVFVATRSHLLPDSIRRNLVLILHILALVALVLSSASHLSVLALAPIILWRASYMLRSAANGKAANTSFKDHLFYLVPVFGGSNTPYGKGPDYLSRFEAIEPDAVARSQLAGIKLLILAFVWTGVLGFMDAAIFGHTDTFLAASITPWSLQLPHLVDIVRMETDRVIATSWVSIYLELIRVTVILAISGHVIIGSLRLLGFNVFRNTYKPLLSGSIVEFWNRYYFYFKELLVEFFFYPTFFRCTWAGPRLRLLLAVFAAAFFGNIYYHMLTKPRLIAELDLHGLLAQWGPRFIYCFLLALGVWLSMLRQQHLRNSDVRVSGLSKFRAILGVWTFYGLIHIWNIAPGEIGYAERWSFLRSLVGF